MIQTLFHRVLRIVLVVFLQIFVFNHINLWGYATPLLGVMVLFRTPLNSGRKSNMFLAFCVGVLLDAFSNTPGVAAGAMTATAFIQHPLIHAIVPKDAVEDAVPGVSLLGRYKYFSYISILVAIHHLVYFTFEAFTFANVLDLFLRLLASYAISLVLAFAMEMFSSSK